MKKTLFFVCLMIGVQALFSQQEKAFDTGEWFKFRMSYSNFLKAGEATLIVKDAKFKGTDVYHVVGKGKTTGVVNWFFKVRDRYESYFDKQNNLPYKFVRKIDEGGHTKDIEITFDQVSQKAHVNNKKHKRKTVVKTKPKVQDMVSLYYYLRNSLDTDNLKIGDELQTTMFFDSENFGFKLKYLGKEIIKIDANGAKNKVEALKFRPYVEAGRVFKEEESLTVWVSNDKNKIPLRIKAELAVGSMRADIDAFKGLKHPFKIIVDN